MVEKFVWIQLTQSNRIQTTFRYTHLNTQEIILRVRNVLKALWVSD